MLGFDGISSFAVSTVKETGCISLYWVGYRFFFFLIVLWGWGNVVAWSFYMLMAPLFSQPHMMIFVPATLRSPTLPGAAPPIAFKTPPFDGELKFDSLLGILGKQGGQMLLHLERCNYANCKHRTVCQSSPSAPQNHESKQFV